MLRRSIFLSVVLVVAGESGAWAQGEPPAEVRATIKLHTTTLKNSRTPSERQKAAQALGELGAAGKLARRDLCLAMMDLSKNVRIAAADSLRKIDEPMYKLATAIFINGDMAAVGQTEKLGDAGEPLLPLIFRVNDDSLNLARHNISLMPSAPSVLAFNNLAEEATRAFERHRNCLVCMTSIAKSDPGTNKRVIAALTTPYGKVGLGQAQSVSHDFSNTSAVIRLTSMACVRSCANIKQALPSLLLIAAKDTSTNRVTAIETLVTIADADNIAKIRKSLDAMRFDSDQAVRAAVEKASDSLKNK